MQAKTPKLLEDIRDSAAFIREATQGKTLEDYRRERLLRQAIERNFEIIGEAANRLAQHDPETAGRITKHRQIVDFRNVLTHGYDLIDHRIVWSTIERKCRYCWPRSRRSWAGRAERVQAGIDRNYRPMQGIFAALIERSLAAS
jgi:uncharacterized protein with HEPN domain